MLLILILFGGFNSFAPKMSQCHALKESELGNQLLRSHIRDVIVDKQNELDLMLLFAFILND